MTEFGRRNGECGNPNNGHPRGASHGVSINENINLNVASCGEFNPIYFATSTTHSL